MSNTSQQQASAGTTHNESYQIAQELALVIERILGTPLGKGDFAAIYDGLLLVRTFTPNNHQSAIQDMTRCNQAEAGLNYVIYKLEESKRIRSVKYNSLYYTTHSRYSKRATNQAMAQSQTMSTVDEDSGKSLVELESDIQEIQNLIEFFKGEIYSIRRKLATIEAIRFNTF